MVDHFRALFTLLSLVGDIPELRIGHFFDFRALFTLLYRVFPGDIPELATSLTWQIKPERATDHFHSPTLTWLQFSTDFKKIVKL